jgi:hypothetical protein
VLLGITMAKNNPSRRLLLSDEDVWRVEEIRRDFNELFVHALHLSLLYACKKEKKMDATFACKLFEI